MSMTVFHVGTDRTDINQLNGLIKEIAYWDERLDNATLEGLSDTTIAIGNASQGLQERRRHIIKRRRANAALKNPRREYWAGRRIR